MKDRASLYPGRVKLIPVSGQENTYDMVRADEPTQNGDPLSKATFLKDSTAALFGLGNAALPDDVLVAIKTMFDGRVRIAHGTYSGTGVYGENNKNSLTFPFAPELLILYRAGYLGIVSGTDGNAEGFYAILPKQTTEFCTVVYDGEYYDTDRNYISFSDKTVTWYVYQTYSGKAAGQFNASGITYGYIAIGGGDY